MIDPKTSFRMSKIRSKNSNIELRLIKALKNEGLIFGRNVQSLPGKPDIVFPKKRVAIFVHSHFWHGWHLNKWKSKLNDYWLNKIRSNMKRDKKNLRRLKNEGWKTKVVWEHQLNHSFEKILNGLKELVK